MEVIEQISKDILHGKSIEEAPIYPKPLEGLIATRNDQLKYWKDNGQLVGLNLANCGLTDDQWEGILTMIDLKQIRALNLNGNKLTSINFTKDFQNLKYLEVCGNKSLTEIKFEEGLPSLERLVVRDNDLDGLLIPEGFGQLKHLDASRNKMNFVGIHVDLPKLEYINLSENNLMGIEFGMNNNSLLYAYLFKNEKLTRLDFARVPLHLEVLHLDNCALEKLPHNLLYFDNLKSLYLHKNPLPDLPSSLSGDETGKNVCDSVIDYLKEYSKGTRINDRVKVILVGNGRVGKTSMLRRLKGLPFQETEKYTHGIQLGTLDKKKLPKVKTPSLLANVWDFGGQEIFHATHQFFLTEEALYVLAWTAEENVLEHRERDKDALPDDNKFQSREYWLENIRHHGGDKCPVLMIQTHFDRNNTPINAPGYLEEYGAQCLNFSAANDHGLDTLQNSIVEKLNKEIHFFGKEFPETYDKVITKIEKLSASEHKITKDFFMDTICRTAKIDVGGEDSVLEFLRKTGVVVWFKDVDSLKDTIFINPDWITGHVYKLINPQLKEVEGIMDQKYVKAWLSEMNEEEQQQFMDLLKNFGLIFELKEEKGTYCAPQYLPEELTDRNAKSALGMIEKNLEQVFSFEFPRFLPDNVMINFLSKYGPYSNDMFWKNGICFQNNEGHQCKVELNENRLDVFMVPDKKCFGLQYEVCNAFVELSKKANAIIKVGEVSVFWQALQQAKADGLEKFRDDVTGNLIELNHFNRFFVGGIVDSPKTALPEIFFSYAWGINQETGENRETIVDEVYSSLEADGLYSLKRDKKDAGYKASIKKFMQAIGRGKLVVVVISDKYLKSPNCMFELLEIYKKAGSDKEEFTKCIFPIILGEVKIYDPLDRLDYVAFWKGKGERLQEKIKEIGLEDARSAFDDFDSYIEIKNNIGKIAGMLADLNTLSPKQLSADNFAEIKKAIAEQIDSKQD